MSIESLFVAAEGRELPAVQALATRVLASGSRVYDLGPGIMERVADTVTPQPVCAVLALLDRPLGEVASARKGERLVVVCADVRDPGNLGAVIRSAAAAGATGVVCCEGTVDPFNPKAVRASAGTLFQLPLALGGPAAAALDELRAAGCRLVATTARGGTDYDRAELTGDVALVFGNEASGLGEDLLELVDERVTIPMREGAESLNVAMSAAVLCFEIARRRRLS